MRSGLEHLCRATPAEAQGLLEAVAAWVTAQRQASSVAAARSWEHWCDAALARGAGPACAFAREERAEPIVATLDDQGQLLFQPDAIASAALHAWSGVWGVRRVQNLQHTIFYGVLCVYVFRFVRFGTWRWIPRPVRVQLTSPGSKKAKTASKKVSKKASHSPAVLK